MSRWGPAAHVEVGDGAPVMSLSLGHPYVCLLRRATLTYPFVGLLRQLPCLVHALSSCRIVWLLYPS